MELLQEEDIDEQKEVLQTLHQQRWATKARRRSSDLKTFMSDRLELGENTKLSTTMLKNG